MKHGLDRKDVSSMDEDNVNHDLCKIASRLNTLTALSDQQSTPLNFGFGAIFALQKAEMLGYKSGSEPGRGRRIWKQAKQLCRDMAVEAPLPSDGEWLAGYFFNDGIIRIAFGFEQLVRMETTLHEERSIEQLRTRAIAEGFSEKWMDSWRSIDLELIRMRHRNTEFINGPEITYQTALTSMDHLATALEWAIHGLSMPRLPNYPPHEH